jgi:Flp pilus assembly pilin Flp
MNARNWIELPRREDGQTMAEYVVVLGVITLAVIAAIGLLALAVSGKFGPVTSKIGSIG